MHDKENLVVMGSTMWCGKCNATWDDKTGDPGCNTGEAHVVQMKNDEFVGDARPLEVVGDDTHGSSFPDFAQQDYEKPSLPDANPKTRQGALKVPLHLVPPSARHYLALAFEDGAAKYDPFNWRDEPVSISVYVGAAGRHLDSFLDGEDIATDSLVHHVAHAMACCAIILDALECGTLNDDRPTKGPAATLQHRYHEAKKDKK